MNLNESIATQYHASLRQALGEADVSLRQRAWQQYERLGLPSRKTETWKYSSLATLNSTAWKPVEPSDELPAEAQALLRKNKADFDIAVIINGQFKPKHSRLTLESGYEFLRFAASREVEWPLEDGLVSASVATHRGGFELRVAPGMRFQRPLLIVHIQNGETSWGSTLNRITLGDNCEFQLAEVFLGGARSYLRTDVTQAQLGNGAQLTWVRTQEESPAAAYFSDVSVRLAQAAQLSLAQLNGGAAWARGTLKVELQGERADANIYGLSFGKNEQHLDQRVEIRHLAPLTNSSQLFKGILQDRARGVLNGKIYIAKHAQKVMSSQLNHNLLMSPFAEADTKPELEVYADDVKANHGATVGKLDDDKLFYLMSRAIPRAEAEQMLARAFVGDVLMKVPSQMLRELLTDRVSGRMQI